VLFIYWVWAFRFDLKKVGQVPERSVVYDRDDELYSRIGPENRVVVPLNKVSKYFITALLAREDTRFYQHHGVDFKGIARATFHNLISFSIKEGGSTLTQQLARNSFRLGNHSFHRKLLEAMVARRIEHNYSKQEILEHYVNRIYFGTGVYGIETASQLYFGKPCSDLNLSESALLAGIIRSPNRSSPFRNLKGALAQRDMVLARMEQLKMVTSKELKRAKTHHIALVKKRTLPMQENYAMDMVRNELEGCLAEDEADRGGLRIYTSIDPELQNVATSALDSHLREIEARKEFTHPKKNTPLADTSDSEGTTEYLQGALIAIDNRTGAICAVVGGRDYHDSKYNRAVFAQRQLGSAFKPFVYTAAFQEGLSPEEEIDDGPFQPGEIKGSSRNWMPINSDKTFLGKKEASYGLIHSRNTMSVRIGQMVGVDRISTLASLLGLGKDIPHVPSIYLGSFETSLKDLTTAYTLFPNHGFLKSSFIIRRIEDGAGEVLYEAKINQYPIFEEDAAQTTEEILERVLDEGTAAGARNLGFDKKGGGKTGTTNDYKDAWFIGFTRSLTCGVWVGFDHPKPIMERGYGATLALPIWTKVMSRASDDRYPESDLAEPFPKRRVADKKTNDEDEGGIEKTFDDIGNTLKRFFTGKGD
jgi:penicillin-binding protein 1A